MTVLDLIALFLAFGTKERCFFGRGALGDVIKGFLKVFRLPGARALARGGDIIRFIVDSIVVSVKRNEDVNRRNRTRM